MVGSSVQTLGKFDIDCDDVTRVCDVAAGLVCTAGPVRLPSGNRKRVCTDKALGSWCSRNEECNADADACDADAEFNAEENLTYRCIKA